MSDTHEPDLHADAMASPGEQLRLERENQGLSVSEVAGALNLRPAVVRGLEEDSYEEVPIATYRRGYLRAYAHLLGIDDTPVLAAYRARFGSQDAAQRKVTPVQISKPPSSLGAWLFRLVSLLVLAGLIGLTLMWWQSRGGGEPPSIGESDPVSVDHLDGSASVTEPAPATVSDEPESLPPLPEEVTEPAVAEAAEEGSDALDADLAEDNPAEGVTAGQSGEATDAEQQARNEAPAATEPAAAQDAAGRLAFTFNEQSWTEVFDASNQRVFVGLQEPGTTASVEGEPPFRLTVGNATGVELLWQGEPVDLPARAGANNVARFTLGE
ncbi:RodZ domain-containing protein [Halomonas sp. H10-9-1]|uniref:RodZ domain-containing protein n=1 Tax=Halomonas sp. H10-9-1 TaxID=2950871 RepID=UPI0032DE7616